jgi:hypothetical protein
MRWKQPGSFFLPTGLNQNILDEIPINRIRQHTQ